MQWVRHPRARILLAFVAVVLAIVILVARLSRTTRDGRRHTVTWSKSEAPATERAGANQGAASQISSPAAPAANPSPATSPLQSSAAPSPQSIPSQIVPGLETAPTNLIIPVPGVRPDQLRDTFSDARSEGRVHDAIDIAAPQGTPVLAVADGTILKLFHSERGGTTVYQLSTDNKFVYYYAHLDRYAEGLTVGHLAKQGETIAFVGDTGNAGAGNYHLHFSISLISNPKRYWEGVNINPYPLLRK
jgi:murein DD-endopeptidase MepM/ murein hydrolase activator NlpD